VDVRPPWDVTTSREAAVQHDVETVGPPPPRRPEPLAPSPRSKPVGPRRASGDWRFVSWITFPGTHVCNTYIAKQHGVSGACFLPPLSVSLTTYIAAGEADAARKEGRKS
jgi:hypothetical protein